MQMRLEELEGRVEVLRGDVMSMGKTRKRNDLERRCARSVEATSPVISVRGR